MKSKEYLWKDLTSEQLPFKYASEPDILNIALLHKRAKQWSEGNSDLEDNMKNCASLNELSVLANMESYYAILIGKGLGRTIIETPENDEFFLRVKKSKSLLL